MTYLEVNEAITKAANEINPNGYFAIGRDYDATLHHDKPFPQIHLFDTVLQEPDKENSTWNITMVILLEDTIKNDAKHRERLINEAHKIRRIFRNQLELNPIIQYLNSTIGKSIHVLSGASTGVNFTFSLPSKNSYCELPAVYELPADLKPC